jgi:hypothetical protein
MLDFTHGRHKRCRDGSDLKYRGKSGVSSESRMIHTFLRFKLSTLLDGTPERGIKALERAIWLGLHLLDVRLRGGVFGGRHASVVMC